MYDVEGLRTADNHRHHVLLRGMFHEYFSHRLPPAQRRNSRQSESSEQGRMPNEPDIEQI